MTSYAGISLCLCLLKKGQSLLCLTFFSPNKKTGNERPEKLLNFQKHKFEKTKLNLSFAKKSKIELPHTAESDFFKFFLHKYVD